MIKLDKGEENMLYYIYKNKCMVKINPFKSSDLESEFSTEYDQDLIHNTIIFFVNNGCIVDHGYGNYGIPNINKFNEIKKLLRKRRMLSWLRKSIISTGVFFWKHFIVTIIVSAITAYIITKYITP